MRSTPAGARYYMDILRDRLLYALKRSFGRQSSWQRIETMYAGGKYGDAAELVLKELARNAERVSPAGFRSFTNRLAVRIDNAGGKQRDDWPIVLRITDIQGVAGDFNPKNCAVVAPDRWIDWLEIPHQVDEIDKSIGKELSFLATLPAGAVRTYYIYYSPTGQRDVRFVRMTGAVDNSPPNCISWESDVGAYRWYTGQFDFFGKKQFRYVPRHKQLVFPIAGGVNYHRETDWGIDGLHVGATSGLGGLTLYTNGREYRVQNPAGKGDVTFTRRVLASGPIRAAVEITAENVIRDKPDLSVRTVCIVYAGHQEGELRVQVSPGGWSMRLAAGLTKLNREKVFLDKSPGCLGTWGYQDDVIGEVGLGLIVPPEALKDVIDLADERRLLCDTSDGALRYWIIGDWRRGRQYPIAPTISNWRRELSDVCGSLLADVKVSLGCDTVGGPGLRGAAVGSD